MGGPGVCCRAVDGEQGVEQDDAQRAAALWDEALDLAHEIDSESPLYEGLIAATNCGFGYLALDEGDLGWRVEGLTRQTQRSD